MDIIEITRQLGAAIQQDERYNTFHEARKKNEEDDELGELIQQIQLIHMSYQHEANKPDSDEAKLEAYDKEFTQLYNKVKENPHMSAYEKAREDVDIMMKYITEILTLCVQGEDPMTCEPASGGCSGDCQSCGAGCENN